MNIERTQFIGHYGVTLVIRFTVVSDNRHALFNLCLLEAKTAAQQVRVQISRLYEKMLAQELPCEIAVAISRPLGRYQADQLNDQNTLIKKMISGAVAAPRVVIAEIAGSLTSAAISGKSRRYHSGDVIIGLDAVVKGGIGPQRSTLSMHIYAAEY